ncbi:MAG: DUF2318 domain-containing protein [Oscillospiraceae bacterium]|jgi:uncharacterized membrane protein|nr:DUF2318 domain-containing protein [Oscillospiraceae bacterium]
MRTETQKKKGIYLALVLPLVLVFTLTACSANGSASDTESGNNNSAGSNARADGEQTIKEGESFVIPISEISETAKFYFITVGSTKMGVVAVKASDGRIRTAFDTCQVCNGSPKAYFEQSGDTLQCQNCGNKFPMDRVEAEAGGCNPVPIFEEDKTVTDESITISYDTLKAHTSLFPSNWRN